MQSFTPIRGFVLGVADSLPGMSALAGEERVTTMEPLNNYLNYTVSYTALNPASNFTSSVGVQMQLSLQLRSFLRTPLYKIHRQHGSVIGYPVHFLLGPRYRAAGCATNEQLALIAFRLVGVEVRVFVCLSLSAKEINKFTLD